MYSKQDGILEGLKVHRVNEGFEVDFEAISKQLPKFEYEKSTNTEDGPTGNGLFFSVNHRNVVDGIFMSFHSNSLEITASSFRRKKDTDRTKKIDFIDSLLNGLNPKKDVNDEKDSIFVFWTLPIKSKSALTKCIDVANKIAGEY